MPPRFSLLPWRVNCCCKWEVVITMLLGMYPLVWFAFCMIGLLLLNGTFYFYVFLKLRLFSSSYYVALGVIYGTYPIWTFSSRVVCCWVLICDVVDTLWLFIPPLLDGTIMLCLTVEGGSREVLWWSSNRVSCWFRLQSSFVPLESFLVSYFPSFGWKKNCYCCWLWSWLWICDAWGVTEIELHFLWSAIMILEFEIAAAWSFVATAAVCCCLD